MSNAPKIESTDLTVGALFKDFYSVPDFQREYVWQPENVSALFNDITDELFDSPTKPVLNIEYFIGSIVCFKDDTSGVYQLIDGQQRITTLYLFLCVLRDFIRARTQAPDEALTGMIASARIDDFGQSIRDYRLRLQYEDSKGVLEVIAKGEEPLKGVKAETVSIESLLNAYNTLTEELESWTGGDVKAAQMVFGALVNRVKLIRIVTPNLSHALKVFETINDRGVGLNAMDLLKNLLFMRASSSDYAKLKSEWKRLTETIEMADEKPLRFLRYFIMANYVDYKEKGTGKPVREDQIYQWIQDRSVVLGIDSRPLDFLKKLLDNAERYRLFAEGKNNQGQNCRYLDNIKLVSGKARQHFVLLLAAPNLGAGEFSQLARELENLFFVFIVTREPTKTFDNNFGDWAKELLAATCKEDVQRFIETRIHGELRRLSARFDFAMKELSEDNIQKYRIRYVLAKLCQFIDEEAEPAIAQLEKSLADWIRAYEIEHILPQTPTPQWLEVFTDPAQRRASTAMLGNLALLEAPLNAAIGNMTFSEKLQRYKASKLYLTQSIAMRPVGGKNTSIDRAVADLAQFETWAPQTIADRQNLLANLARSVWSLPAV